MSATSISPGLVEYTFQPSAAKPAAWTDPSPGRKLAGAVLMALGSIAFWCGVTAVGLGIIVSRKGERLALGR